MSIFSEESRQRRSFKKFYEETGVQITQEPIGGFPKGLEKEAEYIYDNLYKKRGKLIPKIEELIKKYPEEPSLKNYLHTACVLSGKDKKAEEVLQSTLKEHPKYLFAICSVIMNLDDAEELKKNEHLLGNPREITSFYEKGEKIHVSEYLMYQNAAGHFEAITGDYDRAKGRLRNLMDLKFNEDDLKRLAGRIAASRFLNNLSKTKKQAEKEIVVEAVSKLQYEYTKEPPKLVHTLLHDLFYEKSIEKITKTEIGQVMELPRESLIADLNLIVEDAIRRQPFYDEGDYDEDTFDFVIHALYFLGALKAEESLDMVLNLFRMERSFLDYWMADRIQEFSFYTLYALGERQLDKLKKYVFEEGLDGWNRGEIAHVVSQVAMHQPERRKEVLDWFEEVLTYHLENPKNKGIIDSHFLGMAVWKVFDFKGKELLPLVEQIYSRGWMNESMIGNLEEVTRGFEKPFQEYKKEPLPKNIYEYYSGDHISRKVPYTPDEEERKLLEVMNSPEEKLILKSYSELFNHLLTANENEFGEDYEEEMDPIPEKTIVRNESKVGRNDPCLCGSGKKYKHCCLRK